MVRPPKYWAPTAVAPWAQTGYVPVLATSVSTPLFNWLIDDAPAAPEFCHRKAANRPLLGFEAGLTPAGRNERAISRKTWCARLPLATSESGTPLFLASWNG